MNRSCLILILSPFLLVVGCCVFIDYSRSLPNGHHVFYARTDSCYISDADGSVVVDDNIALWEIGGQLVRGVMSNGIEFTLDTKTSTTTYSNGIVIVDGKGVKIRNFPNGYSLYSNGNSQHVIGPGHFWVGPVDALDIALENDTLITGTDDRGMQFQIDTETRFYKFQMMHDDGIAWAAKDNNYISVIIEPETTNAE